LRDVTLSRDQAPRNVLSRPGLESFLEELYTGRLRWDLLDPFPLQDDEDRRTGDEAAAGLERLLRERVDPTEVDLRADLPEEACSFRPPLLVLWAGCPASST